MVLYWAWMATGVALVFFCIIWFLVEEFQKKLEQFDLFFAEVPFTEVYYPGAKALGRKPGMWTVVLRGKQPTGSFRAYFGIELDTIFFQGFDPLGTAVSNDFGIGRISLYLGKGPATFRFYSPSGPDLRVSWSDDDQRLQPYQIFPPHWFQRLGIYG